MADNPFAKYARPPAGENPFAKYVNKPDYAPYVATEDNGPKWSDTLAPYLGKDNTLGSILDTEVMGYNGHGLIDLGDPNSGTNKWARSLGDGLDKGRFFGFGDEIKSAIGAAGDPQGFGKAYSERLASERAKTDRLRADNPWAHFAGELATGALLPVGGAARAVGTGGLKVLPRILNATKAGAAYGGVYGLGEGEGGAGRVISGLEGVAAGGLTGGVLEGGAQVVAPAARAVWKAMHPNQGVYQDIAGKLGDVSINDLTDSAAVGSTQMKAGAHGADMTALGDAAVANPLNPQAASQAATDAIAAARGIQPNSAAKRLSDLAVHKNSPMLFGEYANVVGSNEATRLLKTLPKDEAKANEVLRKAGDIDTTGMSMLTDYLANSGTGKSASAIRSAVTERQSRLRDDMKGALNEQSPHGITLDDAQALLENAEQARKAEYARVHSGPINQQALDDGLAIAVQKAYAKLGDRGGKHAEILREAIDEFYPVISSGVTEPRGAGLLRSFGMGGADKPEVRGFLNKLSAVQDARGVVRGVIANAKQNSRDDIVQVLQPFYRDVTEAMTQASPAWRRVNDRWADGAVQERALELGQMLTDKPGMKQREALAHFKGMPEPGKDMMRVGYLQHLHDKIAPLGQTHDVAKLFESDGTFKVFRTLFGDKAVLDFARKVRDHKVMTESFRGLGNSRTHLRGQVQKQMDGDQALAANVQNMNVGGLKQWVLEKAKQFWLEQRNRRMAKIVATPMSDTVAIARHLANLKAAQARMRAASKPKKARLSPIGSQIAARGLFAAPHRKDKHS